MPARFPVVADILRSVSSWVLLVSIVGMWWTSRWEVVLVWFVATALLTFLISSWQTLLIVFVAALLLSVARQWQIPWLVTVPDLVRMGLTVFVWSLLITSAVASIVRWQAAYIFHAKAAPLSANISQSGKSLR